MKWYFKAFSSYFDFSGRSRRKEFWVFIIINILISWVLFLLDEYLSTEYFSIASYIHIFLVSIPSISVFLRRLHDVGKTGWNILLFIVPVIGWLWLLMLLLFPGERKPNKWGAYPKGIEIIE